MKKTVRRILIVVLAAVFIGSITMMLRRLG